VGETAPYLGKMVNDLFSPAKQTPCLTRDDGLDSMMAGEFENLELSSSPQPMPT